MLQDFQLRITAPVRSDAHGGFLDICVILEHVIQCRYYSTAVSNTDQVGITLAAEKIF